MLARTPSDAPRKWYRDWTLRADHAKRRFFDRGRSKDVNALQRRRGVEENSNHPVVVGSITFHGAAGPVGADGKPVARFHGTREDSLYLSESIQGAMTRGDWVVASMLPVTLAMWGELPPRKI